MGESFEDGAFVREALEAVGVRGYFERIKLLSCLNRIDRPEAPEADQGPHGVIAHLRSDSEPLLDPLPTFGAEGRFVTVFRAAIRIGAEEHGHSLAVFGRRGG